MIRMAPALIKCIQCFKGAKNREKSFKRGTFLLHKQESWRKLQCKAKRRTLRPAISMWIRVMAHKEVVDLQMKKPVFMVLFWLIPTSKIRYRLIVQVLKRLIAHWIRYPMLEGPP